MKQGGVQRPARRCWAFSFETVFLNRLSRVMSKADGGRILNLRDSAVLDRTTLAVHNIGG